MSVSPFNGTVLPAFPLDTVSDYDYFQFADIRPTLGERLSGVSYMLAEFASRAYDTLRPKADAALYLGYTKLPSFVHRIVGEIGFYLQSIFPSHYALAIRIAKTLAVAGLIAGAVAFNFGVHWAGDFR
jgi:hypothetical protein